MFGWYEMDLALGRVGYMPPLQGLGFLWGLLPRALPWAIALCPVGAEDRCPDGGRRLVRRWGPKIGGTMGRNTGAALGAKIGASG